MGRRSIAEILEDAYERAIIENVEIIDLKDYKKKNVTPKQVLHDRNAFVMSNLFLLLLLHQHS